MSGLSVIAMVAFGGALGSMLRYLVAGWLQPQWWPGFPFGIFVVNITGGLAMGLITGLAALKLHLTPEMRAFLTTGILGGYTTFSTFSLDSVMLMERGAYGQAIAYVVGSVFLSILALFCGLWLMRAVYA
jgi:fluoride exporter